MPPSNTPITVPFSPKVRDWANNYDVEQAELTAAFDLVEPSTHWKDPIDAVVPATADLELIQEAVIHFTATTPTFTRCPSGDPTDCRIRVQADGYRAGPAGDH
jgi:hypothetical protein